MNYEFKNLEDKDSWNNFLLNFPKLNVVKEQDGSTFNDAISQFSFIQSFEWIEFQRSLGRDVYPLGIYGRNNEESQNSSEKESQVSKDKLIGVAAGVIIKAKRGSYLYIRNGPVINWEDNELVSSVLDHLKEYAKQRGLWFVRISPLIEKQSKASEILSSFKLPDFPMNDVEALDTYLMPLIGSEDEIFNSVKKKTRYEIRNALNKCEIITTQDVKYIDDFYSVLLETVKRNNWTAYSKEYITKEFQAFNNQNSLEAKESKSGATIVLAKYQGKFIAGAIFIHFADQTFYHYAASLTEYRDVAAPYAVIWEGIKLAIQRQHKFFNFWGITPENAKDSHPWTGLTRFKFKFPGFSQRWNTAKDLPVSWKYWLTHTFEKIDKAKKGY